MARTKAIVKTGTEIPTSSFLQKLEASRYKNWTSQDGEITVKYKRPSMAYLLEGGVLPAFFTQAIVDSLNTDIGGKKREAEPVEITKQSIIDMERGSRKLVMDIVVEPKFHEGETDESLGLYNIELFEEYMQEFFQSVVFSVNELPVATTHGEVSAQALARFPDGER